MNWLDIVILVMLVVPTLIGMKIGVIKMVLSLAGVIAGIVLAGRYHHLLSAQLTFISQDSVASIVAFAIILVGVMIAAAIAAALLQKITSLILLAWVNHLGGAVLGLILGALFSGALLAIWVNFLGISDTLTSSALAVFLLDRFPLALALLPAEFDALRSFFR